MTEEFTATQEAALLRTLRDIRDGHLTLWVTIEQDDQGKFLIVSPDRPPAAGTPEASGEWWQPMLDRGWLALYESDERAYLWIETSGVEALEAGGW